MTLIRHAESEMNLRSGQVVGGRSNHTPLSDAGAAAADSAGRELAGAGWTPAAVYCTSALRSSQTARLLVDGAGWDLPILVEDGLLELSQGAAEGQPRDEWWTPSAVEAMRADPLGHRLAPGGETHVQVQARMSRTMHRFAAAHPGEDIVAVGHGIAMRTLAWDLLGGGHDVFRALSLANLGRVTFEVDADGVRIPGGWPRSVSYRPPGA